MTKRQIGPLFFAQLAAFCLLFTLSYSTATGQEASPASVPQPALAPASKVAVGSTGLPPVPPQGSGKAVAGTLPAPQSAPGAPVSAATSTPSEPQGPPEVAPSDRVTLAQAEAEGLRNNPQIAQALHTTAGAKANLSGQRAPLNPIFSYSGINNTVAPTSFGDPSNYALAYTLETSGRQGLRTRQARAQLQGAQYDEQTTRLSVRQAVAAAYVALQIADYGLDNEREAYTVARRLDDLTQKQFSLGAAPETNAIRTRIALTQEEQNLLTAINNVLVDRANLNLAMGRDPGRPIDCVEKLAFRPISVTLTSLQEQALRTRPEIRSAEAARHALEAEVGLQRSQSYPDVVVATDLRARQVEVGFALPLFDLGSIRGAVHKAKEDVQVQRAQEQQTRQQVLLDVQSAYLALDVAARTVRSFEDGILPRAESLLKRIEQGYGLGANTVLDLIDAQETYRTTRNDYANAIGNYAQAEAQLERAIGAPPVP